MKILYSRWRFNLFLLAKLPMGFMAGLRIQEINLTLATIQIRYQYLTKNPFKSIYFACLSMAGELASGALAMLHLSQQRAAVSMLVVKMEAEFIKKAVGKINFTCKDGHAIQNAIDETISTSQGMQVWTTSEGVDESGNTVAIIKICWSFKKK